MATISGVKGQQYVRTTDKGSAYEDVSYQYATSSFLEDNRTNPALIVQPKDKSDIATTLQWAKSQKLAVAIRTGGHQYCGASSTNGKNIQLDLGTTFRNADDLKVLPSKDGQSFVRTSVSWSLTEFNAFLGKNNLFIPHGQCAHVHVGGHVQTGGYGQLARSFGLFGDHVISLEIVDYDGNFQEVTKQSDPDLFYALLGGSPGNLGVICHFVVSVHRDSDYEGSVGLKALYWYSPETLKFLFDILTEMTTDANYPRNYDYTISVLSSSFQIGDLFDNSLDKTMKKKYPSYFGKDNTAYWPRTIVVYAQWVPFDKGEKVPNMSWFNKINSKSSWELWWLGYNRVEPKPMSQLTRDWIFGNVREFDHPFVKSTRTTKSMTLGKTGWSDWLSKRIDALVAPDHNGCYLSAQIQFYGGKNSMFAANANNGTSYSWRDSTVVATLDAFYDGDGAESFARQWQQRNEDEAVGKNGIFSPDDRRVLWGSFGEYNLDKVWSCYYDNKEKYQRLQKIRQKADPNGTFTANTFCVKAAS